ncbi:carboxypeptidase regulatory-like domain-containing protein, partial [bacterium]|nr:carboxypeptidase regulatory-like domain-containing protein [bacterium]
MRLNRLIFCFTLLFVVFISQPVSGDITVDPIGIAISLDGEDPVEVEVTLSNSGDEDVAFTIGFDEPEEERWQGGPRRDQPESVYALFQESDPWGYNLEQIFQGVDDLDYTRFQNWNQDFDLNDFDAIWVANYQSDNWVSVYNENIEIVEEWVDGGGAYFMCSGSNFDGRPIHPGGLTHAGRVCENPGYVDVEPEDNFLIEFMEWERDMNLQGGCFNIENYPEGSLEEIENCDWFQVIVRSRDTDTPVVVVYEYGRGYCVVSGANDGYLHNRPDEFPWGRTGEAMIWYLDFLAAPQWIAADPEEGVIPADDAETFNVVFIPEEMEDGVYEMIVQIELSEPVEERDDLEQTLIELTAIMSLNSPTAAITGTVTDEGDNNPPIEGAMIDMTGFFFTRFSDNEGNYGFENLPSGDYALTFTAVDFLPTTEEVTIEEDDVELDIALLHSTCLPSEESFNWMLEPDMEHTFNFVVDNDGNGPLTYRV